MTINIMERSVRRDKKPRDSFVFHFIMKQRSNLVLDLNNLIKQPRA